MSIANTEIPNWQTPAGLAATPTWLTWLTDPAQRLLAATAYRTYPDQSKPSKGARFEAAVLALGYRPEVAALFRDGPTTPERAEATLFYRAEQKLREEKWAAEQSESTAKEEKFNRSAAGRRRARALKQEVLQVHYVNHMVGVVYVTNKVWHKLLATPLRARLMGFNWGTLGDHDGTDDRRIFQSAKAVKRLLAQRILKCEGIKDVNGNGVGEPDAIWSCQAGSLTADQTVKVNEFFQRRIIPWVKKTLKK